MADEITSVIVADARLTHALTNELQLALADRFSILGHPTIFYAGNAAGRGSTTFKIPLAGLDGFDEMDPVAEGIAATNKAFTLTGPTVAVARQAIQREMTDLADFPDSIGLNVQRFIPDALGAALMRFTSLIANITDDFTSVVGVTATPASVDDFFALQFTLMQASVPGPWMYMGFPKQVTQIVNSIRAEGGAIQHKTDAQDMLNMKGQGFVGSLNMVDIAKSTKVPDANGGADSAGAMWGRNAIGYADGTPRLIQAGSQQVFPAGTRIMVELQRQPSEGQILIVGNYYVGVLIIEDLRGATHISER